MTDVLKQLQEVIRKSLPEQVGAELKEYLEEAEENARRVEALENDRDILNKDIKRLSDELSKANKIVEKVNNIFKKELELDKREMGLDLLIAKARATEAEKRSDDIKELVEKVFTYRRHVVINEDVSAPGPNDQFGNPTYTSTTSTKSVKDGEDAK